jgi:hypothetical protein
MRNLIIHNPTNDKTKYYRDYNLFWDDLTNELKKEHIVEENRFFEDAHFDMMKIELKKKQKNYLKLLECEYVIEDKDTGEFWILSVAEQITSAILTEKDNPFLRKVLYSQYIPDQIVSHCDYNSNKFHPWIFFPQNVVNLENYYDKRKVKTDLIPKLFFKGNTEYRPIVNYIDTEILSDTTKLVDKDYFDVLTDYEICLSVGGTANGDLCYRDIECMALGVPLLRFDYVTTLNPPLIPNYHYISIPLQLDLPKHNDVLKDRLGNEKHAKLIEERFKQSVDKKYFLNYISFNARKYYEKYLSRNNRITHTINLLGL